MADRDERGQRLAERFRQDTPDETDEAGEPSKKAKPSKPDKTDKAEEVSKSAQPSKTAETSEGSVKEKPSVLMYLSEDVKHELDLQYREYELEAIRDHDTELEKNQDYYPAVIKAGLDNITLTDVLDD